MKKQDLEETMYRIYYCVYANEQKDNDSYLDTFDNKKQANDWAKKNLFIGYDIRVCAELDEELNGNEYAYGKTQAEALKNLKKQVAEYGRIPYDPWKE